MSLYALYLITPALILLISNFALSMDFFSVSLLFEEMRITQQLGFSCTNQDLDYVGIHYF